MDISPASRRTKWSPAYFTSQKTPFFVDFEPLAECPVSYITSDPEVLEIMITLNKARLAFDACGASLFGPNFSEWPVWAAEALVAIETERALVDAAQMDAERRDVEAAKRKLGKR